MGPRRSRSRSTARATDLLARTLLGYDVMYLMRGAPTVYYGDEVGMIGRGGDQQARQDMFPNQVDEWKTQPRVGLASDRRGLLVRRDEQSDRDTPTRPRRAARRASPRCPPARRSFASRAVVSSWSAGSTPRRSARVRRRVQRRHHGRVGDGRDLDQELDLVAAARQRDAVERRGRHVDVRGAAARNRAPRAGTDVVPAAPQPTLKVVGDDLSNMWRVSASVAGGRPGERRLRRAPRTRRLDASRNRRFASLPRVRRSREVSENEAVALVAVVRGLDGTTATSKVVRFVVRRR